jgi:hypothetical protein
MNALPAEIEARIDDERRKLLQACELLRALALAYQNDPDGCDYDDATLAIREMIDRAVAGLDPTALKRKAK